MINIKREQFYDFIKTTKDTEQSTSKSTQHYLDYFDKYQSTGKKSSWNWASFITPFLASFFFPLAGIASSYWFFFRRMHFYGLLSLIIKMAIWLIIFYKINSYFPENKYTYQVLFMIILIANILVSIYANYIYLFFSSRKISKGREKSGVSKKALCYWTVFIILKSLSEIIKR